MSYLVEQLPHCDLLRLSLLTGRFVRTGRAYLLAYRRPYRCRSAPLPRLPRSLQRGSGERATFSRSLRRGMRMLGLGRFLKSVDFLPGRTLLQTKPFDWKICRSALRTTRPRLTRGPRREGPGRRSELRRCYSTDPRTDVAPGIPDGHISGLLSGRGPLPRLPPLARSLQRAAGERAPVFKTRDAHVWTLMISHNFHLPLLLRQRADRGPALTRVPAHRPTPAAALGRARQAHADASEGDRHLGFPARPYPTTD